MGSTTEKVLALMRRLKIEMNGAVTDAMRGYGGVGYGLNYGVSLPTIKEVADAYHPDHELALSLWRQDVRELKLAALFVEDAEAVTSEQMERWSAAWRVAELAEQSAMQLFWRSPAALEVAIRWINSTPLDSRDKHIVALRRLAGFYILGRLATDTDRVADSKLVMLLGNEAAFGVQAKERSVTYALREIYRHRPALRDDVLKTLDYIPPETANEVRWQVEYL